MYIRSEVDLYRQSASLPSSALSLAEANRKMQTKWSHVMLLAICCLIGAALASPVKRSERSRRALVDPHLSDTILIPQPPIQIYWIGLPMGSVCKNDSQCMSKLECGQPIGYGYDTTRCCGTFGATGCKIGVSGGESGCCVHSYHCEWRDQAKKTTWCMPTIYKR